MLHLGRLLWKQVRWWWPSLCLISIRLCVAIRKGIIWLLLATVGGVPPAVGPAIFCTFSFHSSSIYIAGLH